MVPSHQHQDGPVAGLPVLGVVARRRTYRHLALLLLLFPVGIANVVFLVTGISIGLALTPLLVGIPILGLVLVGVTWLASWDADLLSALTDREVSCEGFNFGSAGFWAGLRHVAGESRTWVLLVAMLVSFPLGVATFSVLVTLLALGVALLLAPVAAPLPATHYRLTQYWALDTPVEWLGASLSGAVLLVATLWMVTVAA